MINGLAEFIENWGYLAVILGSMIEGESVIITASALSAFGYLSIYKVFLATFITTVISDQLLFLVGYKIGTERLVKRFPKLKKTRDKIFDLLHKMDVFLIFSFRFMYGIRTISPLVIGSAHIRPKRFITYNFLSGLCWAFVSCFLGYTITDYVMDQEFNTMPAIIAVTGIIFVCMGLFAIFFKIKEKKLTKINK